VPKLLEQYRERLRVKHYSLRTEDAYLHWVRRFIYFHAKRHPKEMAGPEVEAFLSHLATAERVSASTQNQALSALLFLYREVLQKELPWTDGITRAKRPARVPVVLTQQEVRALLARLDGTRWLAASLLYATGMRLLEGLRLRVKDVDFERREITVRDGKGGRDRRTMLSERLIEPLRSHLARVKLVHERDLAEGFGERLTPLSWNVPFHAVIVRPPFGLSTQEGYARLGRGPGDPPPRGCVPSFRTFSEVAAVVRNDFEAVLETSHPEIAAIRRELASAGADAAGLSGSGSAVFGLFTSEGAAREARGILSTGGDAENGRRVFVARSV